MLRPQHPPRLNSQIRKSNQLLHNLVQEKSYHMIPSTILFPGTQSSLEGWASCLRHVQKIRRTQCAQPPLLPERTGVPRGSVKGGGGWRRKELRGHEGDAQS